MIRFSGLFCAGFGHREERAPSSNPLALPDPSFASMPFQFLCMPSVLLAALGFLLRAALYAFVG